MALIVRPCTRNRSVKGWEYQITYKVYGTDLDTFLGDNSQGASPSWVPSGVSAHVIDLVTIPDAQHWRVTIKAVENGYDGA